MESYRDRIATVGAEGERVWVYPKFMPGRYFKWRTAVATVLMAVLLAGPWIRIGGEPLLLLDIVHRKFVLFGAVFWPQDTFLFALAMITIVVAIALFTVQMMFWAVLVIISSFFRGPGYNFTLPWRDGIFFEL